MIYYLVLASWFDRANVDSLLPSRSPLAGERTQPGTHERRLLRREDVERAQGSVGRLGGSRGAREFVDVGGGSDAPRADIVEGRRSETSWK